MDKEASTVVLVLVLFFAFVVWSIDRNEDSTEFRESIISRIHEVNREYIYDPSFNKDTLLYYNTLEIQILETVKKDKLNCSFKPMVLESWLSPEEIRYLQLYRKFNYD